MNYTHRQAQLRGRWALALAQGHNKAMVASMKHVLLNIGVYIVSMHAYATHYGTV